MAKQKRIIRQKFLGLTYLMMSLFTFLFVLWTWTFGKSESLKRCQIALLDCPTGALTLAWSGFGIVIGCSMAFLSWVYFSGIEVVADNSKSDEQVLDELRKQ